MGTHSKLPSNDLESGRSLLELVQEDSGLMSAEISERYEKRLPFLFKVLSINKALSIQAHPNKVLAKKLHSQHPDHYPGQSVVRRRPSIPQRGALLLMLHA